MIVPELQQFCGLARIPAGGDDVFGSEGRPLDQLADEFEADASRSPRDEDTTSEHSVDLSLMILIQVEVYERLSLSTKILSSLLLWTYKLV